MLPGRRYIQNAVLIGKTLNGTPYTAIAVREPIRAEEDGGLVRLLGEGNNELLVSQIKSFDFIKEEGAKPEEIVARFTAAGTGHPFWFYFEAFEENGPEGVLDEVRFSSIPQDVNMGFMMTGGHGFGMLITANELYHNQKVIPFNHAQGAYVLAQYEGLPEGASRLKDFERIGHKHIMLDEPEPEELTAGIKTIFGKEFSIGVLMVKLDDSPLYTISRD